MTISLVLLALLACGPVHAQAKSDAYQEGSRLLSAGNHAEAVTLLAAAAEESPGSAKIWFKLGMAYSGSKDNAGAIAAYRRAIELDPRHAMALNNLANVYFRQGSYEEAAAWYRKALEIQPDYMLAAYHYGWVLRQQNQPEPAEKMFRHCLSLTPSNDRERRTQVDSLYYLGTLRFRAGDWSEAAASMERVLAAFRAHPEARYYLAMAYRRLGRTDEAREQLEIHRQLLGSTRGKPIERQREP